jgi:hypothetical protein
MLQNYTVFLSLLSIMFTIIIFNEDHPEQAPTTPTKEFALHGTEPWTHPINSNP